MFWTWITSTSHVLCQRSGIAQYAENRHLIISVCVSGFKSKVLKSSVHSERANDIRCCIPERWEAAYNCTSLYT